MIAVMQVCGANRTPLKQHDCIQQLSSLDSIFSGSFDANPLSPLICRVEESEVAAQACRNEAVQIKKTQRETEERMREKNTERRKLQQI